MTDIAEITDTVICGDCLEVMRDMPDNCVDSCLCDPPYGLGFMGKDWDTFKAEYLSARRDADKNRTRRTDGRKVAGWGNAADSGTYDYSRNEQFQAWCTVWAKECLRVAKPGAILMAFGGTRTYHRLTCAIEDAGWEIRDCVQWIYGSGFPKSLDISKAIDKAAGAEREVVGRSQHYSEGRGKYTKGDWGMNSKGGDEETDWLTAPATPLAQQWDGWGTALKPSWEPIIVAMKPLDGTYAENAKKWGVAGLWIDGGRIPLQEHGEDKRLGGKGDWGSGKMGKNVYGGGYAGKRVGSSEQGRFPSNTILSCTCEGPHEPDCPVRMLDEQSGELTSGKLQTHHKRTGAGLGGSSTFAIRDRTGEPCDFGGDSGGASRFFYCAKSSRAERNAGCSEIEAQQTDGSRHPDKPGGNNPRNRGAKKITNFHPTVKPLALMEYLCKLTKTPTGGIVLDPFAGSGSTGIAAYKTNRQYILIEKERDYCKIAEQRIQEERDKYALLETAKGGEG